MKLTHTHVRLATAAITVALVSAPAASAAAKTKLPGGKRGAVPVTVATPVTQANGAVVDITRLVLNTGSAGDGTWSADGWMEGSVTNLPAGYNQLSADLQVNLVVGCVDRADRSVPRFEEQHPLRANWRAMEVVSGEGASWGPRLTLGEDFAMQPYPWEVLPESCPRDLSPALVRSEVTSATVQYSHDGVEAAAITVRGVFSHGTGAAPQ